MLKDFIKLTNGVLYRVELNWNALVGFLESTDRDDITQLASFSALKPSDLAGLLAAGINEGERLEGRESTLTASDVGALSDVGVISEFIKIFTRQTTPRGADPDEGKKE